MGTTQDCIPARGALGADWMLPALSKFCIASVCHPSWQRPYLEKEVMKLFSMHRTM